MMLFHATNRPRRTGFSPGDPRYEDSGSARCRLQKSTAWKFHSLPRWREAAPHVSGKSYTVYRRLERVPMSNGGRIGRAIGTAVREPDTDSDPTSW